MSRTDVHRPWDVQLADPHNRHLLYWYPGWPWEQKLTPWKNLGCGCRMCTNHYGRKWNNRSIRVAWRNRRQQALKLVDRSDFDGYVKDRGRWL